MLRHRDIWQAVDRLAQEHGFSASGLARKAGLDPTTFNKSKRTTRDGKLRWPSTESVSKILAATGASLGEFVSYIGERDGMGIYRNIPLAGFEQAAGDGFFDEAGHPMGSFWDETPFPDLGDPHAYALEIGGNGMQPVYRDGDTIVVSPHANVRRGDRVVVKTKRDGVLAKRLSRRSPRKLELQSFDAQDADLTLSADDVEWIARIVWASQ